MESLNSSTLNVVLKIREGSGFGFLTTPFVITCNLNGNVLTTDPIPCSPNPIFETDFVWEAEKKFLRSMRSNNYSIRMECFSDAKYKRHDKVGYILLNMKQQAQVVSASLGANITCHWHKLLGVRNDAKSFKPEIYLSLYIKEAGFDVQSSPLAALPAADNQEGAENMAPPRDVKTTAASSDRNPVQVGSPRETDCQFVLTVCFKSVYNLTAFLDNSDSEKNDLKLEFALFGDCYKTKDLSACEGTIEGESVSVTIKSQMQSLVAYFTEFPNLFFLLQASGNTVAKSSFDMNSFLPESKCEELVKGKVSALHQESQLNLEGDSGVSESYFKLSVNLEVESTKVKNAVKPFTVSNSSKKVDKYEERQAANKGGIKGISCKTRTNPPASASKEQQNSSPKPVVQSKPPVVNLEPQLKPQNSSVKKTQSEMKSECSVESNQQLTEVQNNWQANQPLKMFTDISNVNQPLQCLPQCVYPCFQQNYPHQHFVQDGRGDCEMLQNRPPGIVDSVKAKVSDELSKKTYEELEEWKEKQKELYKAELKKKLDKEVKRLTSEWLSRQNQLEKEATTNIEESVSLSQQLHSTSAELKVRLETVNKQQAELEKEREELEKTFTAKYAELREASKKHQASLQQQITGLTGEVEELKAKTCSLLKENEMLRLGQFNGNITGDLNKITSSQLMLSKSAHLTEQQTTALLVDMKSLEEKLSAALESKEFFRKEWSRALREIHRMKTEQEEQVRLQLKAQRQELDNLRLVGLITADEKASKDDLASLRDLKNQIVRLNTPKSS